MIIALAKYIRTELEDRTPTPGEPFPRHFTSTDAPSEH